MKGRTYYLYKKIYDISLRRQNILQRRFKQGDIAKIYLTENKQYITKRKAQMLQAEMDAEIAAQSLALYYRNDAGDMITPTLKELPYTSFDGNIIPETDFNDIALAVARRPEFDILQKQRQQARNDRHLFENELLPKADFDVKFADDLGDGSSTRDRSELIMKLNFSIPLGRRVARAKIARTEILLKELEAQEKLLSDNLHTHIRQSIIALNNMKDYITLIKREENIAQFMTKAEDKRFKNGLSDLFTLNQREEQVAEVTLRLIKAYAHFYKVQARLYALTANKEKLSIL